MIIDIQIQNLDEIRKRLSSVPEAASWAIMKLLNEVAKSGRDKAVDVILERYNIHDRPVRHHIQIIPATTTRPEAVIRFSGTRFPLQMFKPEQTLAGVTVEEIKGQRSTPISHVFRAVMQYGPNVFQRLAEERGPVRSVTGLSVANMAREETKVLPAMDRYISERIAIRAPFWIGEALKPGHVQKYGGH